jgi:hypothetical protein
VFGWVPLPKRFDLLRRRAGNNVTTLHGQESPAHGRTVFCSYIALREFRDVDLVENGEASQFAGRIGQSDCRSCDEKGDECGCGEIRGAKTPESSRDFKFHE